MLININAFWGFIIGGAGAVIAYKKILKKSERGIKTINVTTPEEENNNKRRSGCTGSLTKGIAESSTRERSITDRESKSTTEVPTQRREREMEDFTNTDSRDEQEHEKHSRATSSIKQIDADIPEIPELD